MHPGLIGCLPSAELLSTWNKREAALFATNPERVPALCALPYGETAHMGRLKGADANIITPISAADTLETMDFFMIVSFRISGSKRGYLETIYDF